MCAASSVHVFVYIRVISCCVITWCTQHLACKHWPTLVARDALAVMADSDSESDESAVFGAVDARQSVSTGPNRAYCDPEVNHMNFPDDSDLSTGNLSALDDDTALDSSLNGADGGDGDADQLFPDASGWSPRLHNVSFPPFTAGVGPNHTLNAESTPLDFFYLLFKESMFDEIVVEINRYAAFKQQTVPDSRWSNTTAAEMKAFFAIQVNMLSSIHQFTTLSTFKIT